MLLFSFNIFTGISVLWEDFLVFNFLISFTTSSNDTFKNSNCQFNIFSSIYTRMVPVFKDPFQNWMRNIINACVSPMILCYFKILSSVRKELV